MVLATTHTSYTRLRQVTCCFHLNSVLTEVTQRKVYYHLMLLSVPVKNKGVFSKQTRTQVYVEWWYPFYRNCSPPSENKEVMPAQTQESLSGYMLHIHIPKPRCHQHINTRKITLLPRTETDPTKLPSQPQCMVRERKGEEREKTFFLSQTVAYFYSDFAVPVPD